MKRVLFLMLVLVLVLGLIPMAAAATGSEEVWTDGLDNCEAMGQQDIAISGQTDDSIPVFTSIDAMVDAVRQKMVDRQKQIQVRLDGKTLSSTEVYDLLCAAWAHNGVPYEGDYIRSNMVSYSYRITTGTDESGVYSLISIECGFISDAAMEAEVDMAVAALLDQLDLWDASNYDKVKGIYDWITENVAYDYEWDDLEVDSSYYKHSTHAALIRKEAVCQGFASLYYRLMLELGVDCRYISGISTDITGSENHAWNIVYLDGKYYNCDPTWDRGLTNYYRYFLCTEANFAEHDRDAEYDTAEFHARYPMAVTPYVQNVAASGQINANLAWVLDADTGTLTVVGTGVIPSYRFSHAPWYDYRESVRKIVVSEGITEVGERAFYWCTNCTEVQLPESLTAIREYGFNNLRSLQQITLPSNLRIIEFCGFSECAALRSITLPDSVTTVGSNAFSNCYKLTSAKLSAGMKTIPSSMFGGDSALSSVEMPEGITYIDDTAFINCGFSTVTLPASVTGLGTAVFSGCTSLYQFNVEEGNTSYKAVNGVLFTADGTHLVCYPSAKYGNYTVPEGTKYIDYGAFRSARYLYRVYFPSTLVKIDGYAFSYCRNLYSITLNENILTVGDDAFRSCTSLTQVIFENPNVDLVSYTFADCTALTSIVLPANLRKIPNGLFSGCVILTSFNIPSTVTSIGSSAFLDCDSLRNVTIPGTVKSIGQQAFDFCNKLESITFEEGVQTLGWISIRNAPKLKKVVIPSSVNRIEQPYNTDSYMFDDCPNVVLYVKCGTYGYNYAINRGLAYQATHELHYYVVEPTCTEQGYTHFWCDCGLDDYCAYFEPALGHDYSSAVTAPTCTEQGYTTHTCHCGDSYVDSYVPALGHNYEGGICTGCGEYYVAFQSASISLAGNIGINFYVELGEAVLADEDAYMRFRLPAIDGGVEEKIVRLADAKVDVKGGVTRYAFSCDVHAKQMGDMVTAQMCLSDGTEIGASKQYSVLTYAGYIIEHEDVYAAYPTLVSLLKAMLNYGAYSQINLGYNTNKLANAGLNLSLADVTVDQVSAFRARKAGNVTGLSISSITLILRSETVLRFYFTLGKGCDISDYKFTVAGNYATAQYNPDNGKYYVDVTGIAAKDLDREYGVTVTNADGTESLSVVASAMTYVYQIIANPSYSTENLTNMSKALYAYSVAANNYFN